jgi:hypothetical protein
MSVLISGRFRFEFRQEGQIEAVALEEAGDYVVWLPKVDHRGSATVDNTVMLTLRWPSIKGDHYECPL